MKKVKHIALALLAAGSFCGPLQAQTNDVKDSTEPRPATANEFSISAQLRPRFEYRNGAYRPLQKGEAPAILTHNRTRLALDYAYTDKLKFRVTAQNINVWGQDAQIVPINASSGNFSIFEAFADIKLSNTLRTKVGRQVISLDDERIFGALDWHPAGRSHDALNITWNANKATVQSFFAFNQNYKSMGWNVNNPAGQYFTPADAQPYQHMQMLHAKLNVSATSYISLLFNNLGFKKDAVVNNVMQPGKANNMQTLGANWFGTYGQWKSHLSAYYQAGKNADGKSKSAYMLSASAGYQVSKPVSITLGADYLSGDDYGTAASNNQSHYFDPLYGTHHKFYGFMDYFYVAGPNNVGLLDAYGNLGLKANPKLDFGIAGHLFNAAADVYSNGKKLSSGLGSEADLTFNYKALPMVTINGGYSTYFHTATLRTIKTTPAARGYQDWFWLSLNINPKIFTAKF